MISNWVMYIRNFLLTALVLLSSYALLVILPYIAADMGWTKDLYNINSMDFMFHVVVMVMLVCTNTLVYIECIRSYNKCWSLEMSYWSHLRGLLTSGFGYPRSKVDSMLMFCGTYGFHDVLFFVGSLTIPYLYFALEVKSFNLEADRLNMGLYFLYTGIFDMMIVWKCMQMYQLTFNEDIVVLGVLSVMTAYYQLLCGNIFEFEKIIRDNYLVGCAIMLGFYAFMSLSESDFIRTLNIASLCMGHLLIEALPPTMVNVPFMVSTFFVVSHVLLIYELYLEMKYAMQTGDLGGVWRLLFLEAMNLYFFILQNLGESLEVIMAFFGTGG